MSTQTIEGLAVEIDGSGSDVLMIHGLGGTSNTWQPQLAALTARHRVIRPDLPGSGRSPHADTATLREIARRLSRLLDALGCARVDLVGHSMGTLVCQYLAESLGERVGRMALLGPIRAPTEASRAGLRDRARLARTGAMQEIADAVCKGGLAQTTRSVQPVTVALVREMIMRQHPAGYASLCEALADATAADVSLLASQILLITGDEDTVAPPAATAEFAAALPAARSQVLSACGHWATFERPADVALALGALLDD